MKAAHRSRSPVSHREPSRTRSPVLSQRPNQQLSQSRSCGLTRQISREPLQPRSRDRSRLDSRKSNKPDSQRCSRSRSRVTSRSRCQRRRSRAYSRPRRQESSRVSRRERSRTPSSTRSRRSRSRIRRRERSERRERSREPKRARSRAVHQPRSRERTRSQVSCRTRSRSAHRSCSRDGHSNVANVASRSCPSNDGLFQLFDALKSIVRSDNVDKLGNMHNTVPEFDPARKEQTMTMWLHKVNECSSIYGWSEKQIIHFALPKLRGVAQRWYEGLSSVLFSWKEWQLKLLAAFPSAENYGQMLSDMLAKRARFGDSLETYYYDKIALINRCGITGSKAVECVLHGIDDRSVRLGAEAVQYEDPDKLLAYLRNARCSRVQNERKFTRGQFNNKSQEAPPKLVHKGPRCFNCKQEGHIAPHCPHPVRRCSKCQKVGHDAEQCFSKLTVPSDKTVLRVSDGNLPGQKYYKVAEVNGIALEAFLDFGSDCSMIRRTDFEKICNQFNTDELPTLRGFGNSVVQVLGRQRVNVKIDEVEADIDLFIVPDEAMQVPIMIGQTFTELPHVVVHKTSNKLDMFHSDDIRSNYKIKLFSKCDATVTGTSILEVYTDPVMAGELYVEGGLRFISDIGYSVFPGLFSIDDDGYGNIVVNVPSGKSVTLKKDLLIARGRVAEESKVPLKKDIMRVEKSYQPIDGDTVRTGANVSHEEKLKLLELLNNYRECFASDLSELGMTTVGEMSIVLQDDEPVVYRPYRLSIKEKEVVRDMVSELLENGIIQPSTSPYASPIVLVRKKTGEYRLCIDYRALNKKTVRENYPMPLIDDQLDVLAGHRFYTTLDLASGYYQIPIREGDKHKTAFVTPDGHFEFTRMPFGLANAPATFQRLMNQVLGSARHREALAYLDDVIIPTKDFLDGMSRLEKVLKLFSSAGLTLKLSKCLFFGDKVDYLGFEVSSSGIQPGSRKVEAVSKFPVPQNQHNVRQFLGLASFFRRFVPGFSIIAKPLTHLLRKDITWVWGKEQDTAFRTLQEKLTNKPTLALYNPQADTELHTDACKIGVAGILLQRNASGALMPVAYFSRQTTPEEQNYSSYDLETLAVVSALRKFRVYLIGVPFKVITDCNSLRATFQKRDMIPRVARWWEQMQEYAFSIEYRAGVSMAHVDALSRNPVPTSTYNNSHDVRGVSEESWLATVQRADSEIQRMVEILKDPKLEDVVDVKSNFKLRGDKLFRVTPGGEKWVVPKGVRWQIVKLNHDDIGHFSLDKTLEKIKASYWFPKMRTFIKKYVASCLECSYSKSAGGKRPGYLHPIEKIDIPFDTVHTDHVGPFVRSSRGNMHILVLIDAYTRYVYLKPVKNTKSHTTIRVLKEYFGIFGVPRRLISDRGTSFTSALFKKFIHDKGIKHVLNAVATPRANGQVERYNKVIVDALTAKSIGTPDNKWDDHLPDVQWGMNNTFNKGINHTPAEVLFGVRPTGSSESKVLSEIAEDAKVDGPTDVDTGRADMRREINVHIKECQKKQKDTFDKRRCEPPVYHVGDLVRVERHVLATGQSKKLIPKFQGPYRITAILDHDRFKVEDTPLTRKKGRLFESIVAIDKIRPWLNFNRPHVNDTVSSSESDEEATITL